MISLLKLHEAMWRRTNDIVQSLQKQAPAAKMVGKFAVTFAVTETSKFANRLTHKSGQDKPQEPPSASTS